MSFTLNIKKSYEKQFGAKPFELAEISTGEAYSDLASTVSLDYEGREVWLPITFVGLDPDIFPFGELLLPFATIQVSNRKKFVRTPLTQRRGNVNELYSDGAWEISVNGFLLDLETRTFPEKQLLALKKLYDLSEGIEIDNAITNILLPEDTGENVYKRVVITGLSFPEVKGGRKNYKPFSMRLESDEIFTLEAE